MATAHLHVGERTIRYVNSTTTAVPSVANASGNNKASLSQRFGYTAADDRSRESDCVSRDLSSDEPGQHHGRGADERDRDTHREVVVVRERGSRCQRDSCERRVLATSQRAQTELGRQVEAVSVREGRRLGLEVVLVVCDLGVVGERQDICDAPEERDGSDHPERNRETPHGHGDKVVAGARATASMTG